MKKINFILTVVAGNLKIDNTCSSSISILYLHNTMICDVPSSSACFKHLLSDITSAAIMNKVVVNE
jgi:hypothetical protein